MAQSNQPIIDALKKVLSSSFVFYFKAHSFHWNTEGTQFQVNHDFFTKLYEDVFENTIDKTAEYIRILDAYSPTTLAQIIADSDIKEQSKIPRATLMIKEMLSDTETIIKNLQTAYEAADELEPEYEAIGNFITERLDAHGKFAWQMRSMLKADRD